MSLLVICEVLGLVVNTLTADDKYSRYYKKNFKGPIQMQLSKKPKVFSQNFIALSKFAKHFQHFEAKMCPIFLTQKDPVFKCLNCHS